MEMMRLQARVLPTVAGIMALAFAQGAQAPRSADDREIILDGVIEPSQVVEVSAGVLNGVLESVTVDRGDFVEEGQLLAILDSRLDEANLKIARARVELVAALEATLASRDYFAGIFDRAQTLFEEGVLSSELRDRAEEEALLAESRWRVEQESHTLWRYELERAVTAIEMRRIVSPVSGVVIARLVDPGEFVGQTTLLTIAKLDPLYVEIVAPVELFGSIRVGAAATVIVGEPINGSYRAQVKVVDQVFDAASNTFGVRLELPNPGRSLPAGLRARARLTLEPPQRP
jgi:RND family efflux transporter MFP subunit